MDVKSTPPVLLVSPNPIPEGLRAIVPDPACPFGVHRKLFERCAIASTMSETLQCRVEVFSTDPEYAFVLAYFNHQRPPGMRITSLHYLFNPALIQAFEGEICRSEEEQAS